LQRIPIKTTHPRRDYHILCEGWHSLDLFTAEFLFYFKSTPAHRNERSCGAGGILPGYCSEMSVRSSIITEAIFLYSDFRQAAAAAVAIFMRLT